MGKEHSRQKARRASAKVDMFRAHQESQCIFSAGSKWYSGLGRDRQVKSYGAVVMTLGFILSVIKASGELKTEEWHDLTSISSCPFGWHWRIEVKSESHRSRCIANISSGKDKLG